jgi:hypothetical protein
VKQFVILGGDVIIEADGRDEYTYDNWGMEKRKPTESFASYSARSVEKALKYIEKYPKIDNVFFVPIVISEATAGL